MNNKGKNAKTKSHSIDELPSDAIDAILVRLPIRDAVRTSILSHQWRYRWATMKQLEFIDDGCVPEIEPAKVLPAAGLSNIVNQVLMGHVGPIHKFMVIAKLTSPSKVDQWLILLWRNGIKELVLEFYGDQFYSVHSCLFSCQGITRLDLYCCKLKLPPAFEGFANLSSLSLLSTGLSESCLEVLISKCPLLQKLVLDDVRDCNCFKINSLSLKYLSLKGEIADFSLVRTPILARLSIDAEQLAEFDDQRIGEICNISNILACENSVEKLDLLGYAAEFLSVGSKPENSPVIFERLKCLHLCINFIMKEEPYLLLSLLRGSVHLQELILQGCSYDLDEIVDKKMWEINKEIFYFHHLRFVNIINFECIEPEMELIRFVLDRALVLEKMEISIKPKRTSRELILTKLLRLRRASSRAEIILIS